MKKEIEEVIKHFNRGWTKGEFNMLENIMYEDVIFVAPDLKTQILGMENCINTIKEYNVAASTSLFDATNTDIKMWDDMAVVTLSYYIEYTMNNKNYKENGTEFWMLKKFDQRWKIIWRAIVGNEKID